MIFLPPCATRYRCARHVLHLVCSYRHEIWPQALSEASEIAPSLWNAISALLKLFVIASNGAGVAATPRSSPNRNGSVGHGCGECTRLSTGESIIVGNISRLSRAPLVQLALFLRSTNRDATCHHDGSCDVGLTARSRQIVSAMLIMEPTITDWGAYVDILTSDHTAVWRHAFLRSAGTSQHQHPCCASTRVRRTLSGSCT